MGDESIALIKPLPRSLAPAGERKTGGSASRGLRGRASMKAFPGLTWERDKTNLIGDKMTPTLFGRWQTRLLLLATVGVFVTLPFYLGFIGSGAGLVYFWVLAYVAIFGIFWDAVYIYMQKFRWDRDWPAAFQVLAGIWEAVFIIVLVKTIGLPSIPKELPVGGFAFHYSLVWLAVFIASQSIMRILFPFWRFRGGQWL